MRVTIIPPADAPVPLPVVINPTPPPGGGLPAVPQLFVRFSVESTLTPQPERCTVEIHNLSKTIRDQISGASKRAVEWAPPGEIRGALIRIDGRILPADPIVSTAAAGLAYMRLEAGYGAVLSTIFEGQCTVPRHRRHGNTWVTTLRAGGSELNLQQGLAQMSFPPGTPATTVLAYLAKCCNLVVVPTPALAVLEASKTTRTFHFTGRARDHIDEILTVAQLTWWVEGNQLWTLAEGQVVPGVPVLCSPSDVPGMNRLVESPDPIDEGGARIRTLLAPEIRPGRSIVVASSELAGTYRIESRGHGGDNRGGPFETHAIIRSQLPYP